MGKARRRTGPRPTSTPGSKSNRTQRAGPALRVPRAALLVVEDELEDLAALLNLLPELGMSARVMRDSLSPPPGRTGGSADRLGQAARELFKQRLEGHLTPAGKAFAQRRDGPRPTDLAEAVERITGAVQWRLHRLAAVIRMFQAED